MQQNNHPASEQQINALSRLVPRKLPDAYLGFLRGRNGWSGPVGRKGYLMIHTVEDATEMAQTPMESLPGYFVFGSNGGGLYYAFDLQEENLPVTEVDPFLNREEQKRIADSFTEFLEKLEWRGAP